MSIELNKIYNEDCLEGMAQMDAESVDLIITSPPYNLGKSHHTGNNRFKSYSEYNDDMPEELYQQWQKEILNECFRLLGPNGSLIYNHKKQNQKWRTDNPLRMDIKDKVYSQTRTRLV